MNLKVANLLVVQFGIFIGVMSWLVYSHFQSAEPRIADEMRENGVAPITTVARGFEPGNQRPYAVDYGAERERAQPVDEQPAQWEQSYYQSIAPRRYARSAVVDGSLSVDSPSYAEPYQEPAVVSSDDLETPETVAYSQPIQTIVYQPIQVVAFPNRRHFGNRCRPTTPLNCAPGTIRHQPPERRNPRASDTRVVASPNVSTPPGPPTQGFAPREPVRQTGVTGSQQKRVAFPGSPGATRRALSVP